MEARADMSIEELETVYKECKQRIDAAERQKNQIDAEHSAARRQLKEKLDQARKDGFDPDNMQQEIQHNKEVLAIKLNTYMADIEEAEKIMQPMIHIIEGG
jgi:hypothetical protein